MPTRSIAPTYNKNRAQNKPLAGFILCYKPDSVWIAPGWSYT